MWSKKKKNAKNKGFELVAACHKYILVTFRDTTLVHEIVELH